MDFLKFENNEETKREIIIELMAVLLLYYF